MQADRGWQETQPSDAAPKLGQHFLADRGAAEEIVRRWARWRPSTVVEIGPGKGVLTTILARNAGKLIAIELDRVLAAQLRMKYAAWPNVEILEGDILNIDLSTRAGAGPGALAGVADAPKQTGAGGRQPPVLHHLRHPAAAVQLSRDISTGW